ncbi:MAG: permease-like cell division protein FtsX [Gammaproteobacteria bacterium]|nr:permease-like cell division protein FtsX [Gammaproteobacteria bacterium]MDP7271359.1 permease-like cell division protein FtsX [Gammaproteobacteria bacterium]HJP05152.1 permease-like cell division protein FtsX [Gammaproteobacteria bacterium]
MARNNPGFIGRARRWYRLHILNSAATLRELGSQPIATGLTVTVIGIALALPASLNILVQNGRNLAGGWESVRDFSIYMEPGTALTSAQSLADELEEMEAIQSVSVTPADTALEDFRESSGLGEALDSLGSNPLPHTLVVRPGDSAGADELQDIETQISENDDVDMVKIDTAWVERLNAILDFLRRIVLMASLLLIAAVVIIVGNTIRLDIQNHRDEIEVLKLLGASDGFVRRPFLYVGLWYGLIGSCIALLVLFMGGWILSGPLQRLIGLYSTEINLLGMDWATALAVFGGGILSGWGGAWTAVARHLSAIQPK